MLKKWHWAKIALGQNGIEPKWHWAEMALGQNGIGPKWHLAKVALGQNGIGFLCQNDTPYLGATRQTHRRTD